MSELKKTGIVLTKGSSISLTKNDVPFKKIMIGLNWGAIGSVQAVEEKKGFFGKLFGSASSSTPTQQKIQVDLDGSVTVFDGNKELETICFSNLSSKNGSIRHSGDDTRGDSDGDDGIDNETISINLENIREDATSIFVYLNSYRGQHFGEIPYSKIRLFDDTDKILASYNLSQNSEFDGKVSMIMAKLVKENNTWKFVALGNAINEKKIADTIQHIKNNLI